MGTVILLFFVGFAIMGGCFWIKGFVEFLINLFRSGR